MTKTKKKQGRININLTKLSQVLWVAVMALGLLGFLFIFAPALVSDVEGVKSGLKVTFGEVLAQNDLVKQYIPFSILAFMGYFFPLFACCAMFFNKDKENMWFDIACSVLFLASVILIALIPKYIGYINQNYVTVSSVKVVIGGKLGWGAQLTLAMSFIGLIASLLKWFSDTYEK